MSVKIDLNSTIPLFLTEAHLSQATGIPRKTLQRFRKEGSGPPFVRFGRRTIRYPKDQFRNWLSESTHTHEES